MFEKRGNFCIFYRKSQKKEEKTGPASEALRSPAAEQQSRSKGKSGDKVAQKWPKSEPKYEQSEQKARQKETKKRPKRESKRTKLRVVCHIRGDPAGIIRTENPHKTPTKHKQICVLETHLWPSNHKQSRFWTKMYSTYTLGSAPRWMSKVAISRRPRIAAMCNAAAKRHHKEPQEAASQPPGSG